MTEDKQNITIQLAGLPKFPLAVPRQDEEIMRKAERMVNELWHRWTVSTFASESKLSVMARVAFQFAVLYLRSERSMADLTELDRQLGELLNQPQQ